MLWPKLLYNTIMCLFVSIGTLAGRVDGFCFLRNPNIRPKSFILFIFSAYIYFPIIYIIEHQFNISN